MAWYGSAELTGLLADGESHLVERKSSGADRSGIRRNICAFSNDLAGSGRTGVIFVGVDDEGRCVGAPVTDELLRTCAQMRSDGNILPLPSMSVERMLLGGCDLLVIQVEPCANPPVRYQGRVWVKVGPTVQLASAEEELRLLERRRSGDLPFDMRPSAGATTDELDMDYVQRSYLPAAIAPDVLEQNERPLLQQMRSLRLVSGEAPTWGAIIGCGRDPQSRLPGAYVQFLRVDGRALGDPIKDQKVLTGRLEDVLRRLDDLLEANVSVATDVTSGTREVRRPDYPIVALQQLVRNAVMHRSYEQTNAPVRVSWFADRVEIQSPGGLYGKVTPENFRAGATDYRNPLVAEIMHHLGYAQRFGLGVPLAFRAMEENGNPPPEFAFTPTHVAVTLRSVP